MEESVNLAKRELDAAVRSLVQWHFSPETGTPFWLHFRDEAGWDPLAEISCFEDLDNFGLFQDDWLRGTPLADWVPRAYANKPYHIFETGGTTGRPKQRLDWKDFQTDYERFSQYLPDEAFPPGAAWLMLGPTGPRRLRLSMEYMANLRGSPCFHIDLDPRWYSRLLRQADIEGARRYKDHVLEQGLRIIEHRDIRCLFTTPKLLQALCEQVSLQEHNVTGVLCGGTSISPQALRFLIEELLEGVCFVPVYGNTLMGLAASAARSPEDAYQITYYPPQPRAVLRVVDPSEPSRLVEYGERGRVMLTTLTQEFFMPNFLERDEAIRAQPCPQFPWDGVRDVRPFQAMQEQIVEGVY